MEFPPVKQASHPIGNQLSYSVTAMPLLHQWAYLPWQVGIKPRSTQPWVGPLMSFLLGNLIAPSVTMTTSLQEKVYWCLETDLCSAAKLCGVSSNRVLPHSCGG